MALFAPHLLGQSVGARPDFDSIRQLILREVGPTAVPSISVSVVRDGQIAWEAGFGFSDRERSVQATARTPYYLASITKALTGTALTVLAGRRRVDLDSPVNDYLGGAKVHSPLWNANLATVRRIANHTAGLTTFALDCDMPEPCSMDRVIRRYAVLVKPPGGMFDYSNLAYGVLGEVISQASGRRYDAFMKNEVFEPLGMTGCSIAVMGQPQDAAPQYNAGTKVRVPVHVSGSPGGSAAYCGVHDLARFALFVLNTPAEGQQLILSSSALDQMLTPDVTAAPGLGYNMGWWIRENYFGYRSVYASGGTTDATAILQLIPAERIAVAVLANTGTAVAQRVVDDTLALLLPRFREQRQQPQAPSEAEPQPPPVSDLVGTWSGAIQTPQGDRRLTLWVTPSGDVSTAIESTQRSSFTRGGASGTSIHGVTSGNLRVDDAPRPPYDLEMGLDLYAERLVGSATTQVREGQRGPALSFWVELRKPVNREPSRSH